jgi:hypothetical protein
MLFACQDPARSPGGQRWQVKSLRGPDYARSATEVYVLDLRDGQSFSLTLDVNSCGGNYVLGPGRDIRFEPGCTEVCCDSPFAEALAELLARAERYSWQGNELHLLAGEEEILLRAAP